MTPPPSRRAVLLSAVALLVARPHPAQAAPAQPGGADVAVLNGLLAVEHAVIYDLAAAGATLGVAARARTLRDYDDHRARRDAISQRIRALGGAPVAALPAYADPAPAADGIAEVIAVEQEAVRSYHDALKVLVDPAARGLAAQAVLAESRHLALARASAGLAGAPSPFVTGSA